MNFLIVTGLSGAGKSMAVNALEDIGFFCIDNIPVALLPRIVDFALQGENQLNRVAVVMDVRGVRSIEKLQEALADLDEKKIDYDILFLDANDAASYVEELVGEDANIIFGAMYDDTYADEASITVIATGLHTEEAQNAGVETQKVNSTSTASSLRTIW